MEDNKSKQGNEPVGKKIGLPLIIWGIINIGVGIFFLLDINDILKGILLQALFWGAIDGLIGLGAYFGKKKDPLEKILKVLKVNSVLDVGYMVIGIVLILISPILDLPVGDITQDYVIGSGIGVIIQGAFLLIADVHHVVMINKMI